MNTNQYRRQKVRGFVDWLEPDAFVLRVQIDGRDYNAWIANEDWPPGPFATPTEGVLLSLPKRRDAKWQQVQFPPITEREIIQAKAKAKQWARQMGWLFESAPAIGGGRP